MRLGGGLLVALAAGAAGAGWWLLAGLVLAAVAAGVTARVPEPGDALVDRVVVAVARLSEVTVYAIAFGAYVFPAHRAVAAAAFVVVVAGAGYAGLKIPTIVVRAAGGLLLAAGLALVAVCVAVAPVTTAGGGLQPPDFAGVLVAAVVAFPFLRPGGRGNAGLRVLLLGAFAVVAAFAALYQLGALRLGLSLTSLRDLLSAADADALQPLLTVVAVIATLVPALAAGTEVRARAGMPGLAGVAVAAVAAYFLPVLPVLVVAGLAAVFELLLGVRARRYSETRE
ncbi:hypothetical protein AMES_2156 [Amycolatopsis mediterranei S699]|uniref:Uncharacterized protein n=2 Tax=Amycolatopsis mediterranei TaxID=33910 RepID=A0A0H3D1A9_AMYMU|nr:hypothetical protein [Amycolatopsis mediterranei]ADJ43979.1 hypothetical protein AMED_2176 [Amycolatopsis mediterranei U32]AEK40707.1 hypothetical protein RAM_11085 [Amycolatopsis mediterranei S699]AFO75692.1 hypothetical protein AMES_2156 [Amycolatopsis mediterranei S699]AGT82821.1 hypothetical protein B737_2157 [Amycolatopsis mediterranei RB]KDO06592.1 hypothetical protein DV26_33450 [Amycolatopsis mediterranei]